MTPDIPFKRNAVSPVQCVKDGYESIKDQYWLFVGMTIVALLIGQAVPLGILLGPMMCGLHLSFFKKRRGEQVEFATLFKGFDYFGPSVIASLLYMVPIMVIVVPAYLFFYIGMIFTSVAAQGAGGEPNPGAALGIMGIFILVWVVIIAVIVILSIGFTFSYPLIVDRKLPGFDAVKLSFKAALANFWGLVGLILLTSLIGLGGVLLCIVGVYLVMPIGYAAIAMAYEQVFGLSSGNEDYSNLPPPPPTFT